MQVEKPNREPKEDENGEEFDRFEDFTKKLLKVPKNKTDREQEKREREKRAG